MIPRLWLLVALIWLSAGQAAAQLMADAVYGQPSLYEAIPNNSRVPENARLYNPRGIAAGPDGLYISDQSLNRVLFFPTGSFTATRVYGQPDFSQTTANNGGISAASLNNPRGLAVDATGLYVADQYNNRVLFFPAGSTVATRVYGQLNYSSGGYNFEGVSARSLAFPEEVAVDPEGGVYISDNSNNRVLYYEPGQTTASFVYGQTDFTKNLPGYGPHGFVQPKGVAVDNEGLYVTDYVNNRVLFFPKGSPNATRVYGQPDFYSNQPNMNGVGPNSLQQPNGLCVDSEGLYVSDYLNSRILFFPKGSNVAMAVYGQPDFTAVRLGPNGVGPFHFYVPWNVAADANYVYGSDAYNGRILRWPKTNAPIAASASFEGSLPDAEAQTVLPFAPVVKVYYANGEPAVNYNSLVKIAIASGPLAPCATLSGATTVNAVNGVATFPGLSVDVPGIYRLRAIASSLPAAESNPFILSSSSTAGRAGDVNNDGQFNISDITLTLRSVAGLSALPD